jgi:hypothetical protein
MNISSIALQGLANAESQADAAASALASPNALAPNSPGPSISSVAADMVSLTSAQDQEAMNIEVLKTADEIQQNPLDVMA